jgi:Caspase domain
VERTGASGRHKLQPDPRRRALFVGVAEYSDPNDDLPFVSRARSALSSALVALGYVVDDPSIESAENLGKTIVEWLDATCATTELRIVHIVGHGQLDEATCALYIVGPDGRTHHQTSVDNWIGLVEKHPSYGQQKHPTTLFLVDVCYSGHVARLPWQGSTDPATRSSWVVAACAQNELAFDGRLTVSIR